MMRVRAVTSFVAFLCAGCVPEVGISADADASMHGDAAPIDGGSSEIPDSGGRDSGAISDGGSDPAMRCARSFSEPIGSGPGTSYYDSVATYQGMISIGDTVTTPVFEGNVAHCWILHVTAPTPLRVLSRIPTYEREDGWFSLMLLRVNDATNRQYVDSDAVAPTYYEEHPTIDTGMQNIEPGYYEIGFEFTTSPYGINPPPNPDGTVTLVVTGDAVDSIEEPTERGEIHIADTLTTSLTEPQHHHRYYLDLEEHSSIRFAVESSTEAGAGLYVNAMGSMIDEYRWTPVVTSDSSDAVELELNPGRYSLRVVGYGFSYWDGRVGTNEVTISLAGEACVPSVWHRDSDGDGHASSSDSYSACAPDSPTDSNTPPFDDCNDYLDTIHPGATELCDDRRDNDCDGTTDPESLCPGVEGILGAACRDSTDCAEGFTCSVWYRHYLDPVSSDVHVGGGGAEHRCLRSGESGYPDRWSCHHEVGAPCYARMDCCGALECVEGSCSEGPAPACGMTELEWVGGPGGALSLPPSCRDADGDSVCCPGQGCDPDAHNSDHVTTYRCVNTTLCGIGGDGFVSNSVVNTCCTGYHFIPASTPAGGACVPD